ncbi:hypothetical protein AAF712_014958 [Marasmius tenuissimus]|uniref:Nucleolar pre-ribosomal-associated protein 1 n=1 Tax=Marasmius tenuissimus TaxID=585030 RepID=A0ABR2ZAQ5_9AGAR
MSYGREPPRKRAKLSSNVSPTIFTNVDDVQAGLSISQNVEILTKTLTTLRNQFSLKQSEGNVSSSDPRLLFAQQWLGRGPGAGDLFKLWEGVESRQQANLNANSHTILSLVLSVLSSLLSILSSHYTYHSYGLPIIKTLLSSQYARKLNSFIGGSHTDLVLSSMKLLNSMSDFASGKERRSVLESFHIDAKTFNRLLNMRRKGKTDTVNPLERPGTVRVAIEKASQPDDASTDIRTLTIFLVCSFLSSTSVSSTKNVFFDQHADKFLAVFKGLLLDPYIVVRKFLELCWEDIWCDVKIPKKTKIGLFGEITLNHLLKLYERTSNESTDTDQPEVTADLVHHFLLAICTRPGQGVCFRDRGWHPPSESSAEEGGILVEDEIIEGPRGGRGARVRLHNKILANFLKTLKPNEDLRQQELTLRILGACPELIAGYWAPANLTLEPRLSSRWIANIALFGTIISLPTPQSSFILPNTTQGTTTYNPTPPPLSTIIDNILPFCDQLQSSLFKGTATFRYTEVRNAMRRVADSLEESAVSFFGDDEEKEQGQWRRRLTDLEREVRRRVPDFQVVVGFVGRADAADKSASAGDPLQTKSALLSEAAHRLLWLYHQCLLEVSGEARFDLGKLLGSIDPNVATHRIEAESEESAAQMSAEKLRALKQIHVLRLLSESEQFKASWSGKAGTSKHTSLFILLKSVANAQAYASLSPSSSVTVLIKVLQHILGNSIILKPSHDEVSIWLSCLPVSLRPEQGSESPDGAPLTDEIDAVVTFLDECVQRCVKTPYRYIDDLRNLGTEIRQSNMDVDGIADDDDLPSPLLMTVLEQLKIKVAQQLLSPSDVLAITIFLKKLLFRLSVSTASKSNLIVLGALADKVNEIFKAESYSKYPVMSQAIVSQAQSVKDFIWGTSRDADVRQGTSAESVKLFLQDVQNISVPTSQLARIVAAFELVDWVRLVDQPLQVEDVRCVMQVIRKLHPSALHELAWALPLGRRLLWDGMGLRGQEEDTEIFTPPYELLFRHSTTEDLSSSECRELLRTSVLTSQGYQATPNKCTKAILLISRALDKTPDGAVNLLLLLQSLLVVMHEVVPPEQYNEIKRVVFVDSSELRAWFTINSNSLPEDLYNVLKNTLISTLTPTDEGDRKIASEVANFWTTAFKKDAVVEQAVALAFAWIQYTSIENIFALFDKLASQPNSNLPLLYGISDALLQSRHRLGFEEELHERVNVLVKLPSSQPTEKLLEIVLQVLTPTALDGLPVAPLEDGMIEKAEKRWIRCRSSRSLFDTDVLVHRNLTAMSHAFYRCSFVEHEKAVRLWLQREGDSVSLQERAKVAYTYLDRRRCLENVDSTTEVPFITHFARFVEGSTTFNEAVETRRACSECASILLDLSSRDLVEEFGETIKALPTADSTTPELIDIGLRSSSGHVRETLVDHGLQRVVRIITSAGEIGLNHKRVIHKLEKLLHLVELVRPHIAEPVLMGVLQDRLSSLPAVRLVQAVLTKVQFKPLIVNRHLQAIVQSPQFFKVCREGSGPLRDSVVGILHTLFHLHPSNTCQASHVEPLVHVYRGTLSLADQKLLDIFRLFETEKRVSVASLLARWSPTDANSTSALEGLRSIDGSIVLKTCLRWPRWRKYDDEDEEREAGSPRQTDGDLYDPVFLLLFVAHVFATDPLKSAVDWVEVFRTNIVGFLVRALSSKDSPLRMMAATQLGVLWRLLEGADMQEKMHVVHILALLRDALITPSPPSVAKEVQRLPSHITLLLAYSLRGIFYPSHFIYPLTAKFLLQRPQLDVNDVPMLYAMLYSSNAEDGQWKRERAWMIRFLADGLQSSMDWKVFRRRRTWDLIASLFGAEKDRITRRGILEVLANLTCISQAVISLLLKSSLLSWIEIQLLGSSVDSESVGIRNKQDQEQQKQEHVAWIKILENILIHAAKEKLENITRGEWRVTIARCLSRVLTWISRNSEIGTEQTLAMMHLLSRVALRMTEQHSVTEELSTILGEVLNQCIAILRDAESVSVNVLQPYCTCTEPRSPGPHTSSGLFDLESTSDVGQPHRWSGVVEELWRVAMSVSSSHAWDALSCRILIARSLACRDTVGVDSGEWARRETVLSMNS